MKTLQTGLTVVALLAFGIGAGCSATSTKSADVSSSIRTSLDQAGFKDISVSQDRDKGVVTLSGRVMTDADKAHVESIAQDSAAGQVVSNQIAVVPVGGAADAKAVNSDLDKGIERNLDAALIEAKLHDGVKYAVVNHVVTLTGEVGSERDRKQAQAIAAGIPNVQQVVNELQVTRQKASSSS